MTLYYGCFQKEVSKFESLRHLTYGSAERICLWCRKCRRHKFNPWVGKIPWRRAWQPTPVFSTVENPIDRGVWWATTREAENRTRLSDWACTRSSGRVYSIIILYIYIFLNTFRQLNKPEIFCLEGIKKL